MNLRRILIAYIAAGTVVIAILLVDPVLGSEKKSRRANQENKKTEWILPPVAGKNSRLSVVLGCPTDRSIVVSILCAQTCEGYIEYGAFQGNRTKRTGTIQMTAGKPAEMILDSLEADTDYVYRLLCSPPGQMEPVLSLEGRFHTQRSSGSTFSFAVQADSHLDEQSSPELYRITLRNELADKPDFLIDLGDTFMTDKLSNPDYDQISQRVLLQRGYFSLLGHSVPLFLVPGNHDGEQGWSFNGTSASLAVWASRARQLYFPNPIPDSFYSGNMAKEEFVDFAENYYAWHWGDALFVVIDPYWYTVKKPGKAVDNWSWTLGKQQYDWFKQTLEESDAKFKFVFCHQLIGGGEEGRGGIEFVKYYEMGGCSTDGSWDFDKKRPGWEKPIHSLMADCHVTVFFHGHDHFYARQELDGVVYQLVPQPSHPNTRKVGQAETYGYAGGTILPNSGHLRVTVSETDVQVDYVRAYLPVAEKRVPSNKQTESTTYTIHKSF